MMSSALAARKYRKRLCLNGNRPLSVASHEAAEHMRALQAGGMGLRTMSAQCGVDLRGLQRICNGAQSRILVETHRRVLGLRLEMAPGARVPALPTRRRLQAIVAQGWSLSELDRLRGVTPRVTHSLLKRAYVTRATELEIAALYERLDGAAPPTGTRVERTAVTRSRNYARSQGWAPPAAWDHIEDPRESPKGMRTA